MSRPIWILGGTSEGRTLADWAAAHKLTAYVSVATAYGASLVVKSPYLTVLTERLDEVAMTAFLAAHDIAAVVDATHPYASLVTANIRAACAAGSVPCWRVTRPVSNHDGCIDVDSVEEAVEVLSHTEGPVFLTTGSKNLDSFSQLPDYQERLYVRILPVLSSLERAQTLGYLTSHIICMQGPFTEALNEAMFRQCGARYVVTKDSGKPGGFAEKIRAAEKAGACVVVIGRKREDGDSLPAVEQELLAFLTERS